MISKPLAVTEWIDFGNKRSIQLPIVSTILRIKAWEQVINAGTERSGFFSLMVKVQGQHCASHLQSYNLYSFTVLGSQNMNAKTVKIMFFTGDRLH